MKNFIIDLGEWIIQDENYKDFKVKEVREFALTIINNRLSKSTQKIKSLQKVHLAEYCGTGEVVFKSQNVIVIDFGILVYCDYQKHRNVRIGDYLTGAFSISIDPYHYFESLHQLKGIPPLIYSWRIRFIIEDTYQFTKVDLPNGGFQLARDEDSENLRFVRSTAVPSKNLFTNFMMSCALQPKKPGYTFSN